MPAVSRDRLAGRKTLKAKDFFNEMEKDQVKARIDIVSLFEYFGTHLDKKGKSHTGLCPFHDDKNPSLSVDQEKGLYNCFGCGESGDVFDLVKRIKGVGFTEALAFLKEYSGNGHRSNSSKGKPLLKKSEKVPAVNTPEVPPKDLEVQTVPAVPEKTKTPGISLDIVMEHYKKSLSGGNHTH